MDMLPLVSIQSIGQLVFKIVRLHFIATQFCALLWCSLLNRMGCLSYIVFLALCEIYFCFWQPLYFYLYSNVGQEMTPLFDFVRILGEHLSIYARSHGFRIMSLFLGYHHGFQAPYWLFELYELQGRGLTQDYCPYDCFGPFGNLVFFVE